MANLKDSKYDGKGGAWLSANGSPKVAAQGSIQIGGRVIALTFWHNGNPPPAPHYNITVNEQKTAFEDLLWFKTLHNVDVNMVHDSAIVTHTTVPNNQLIDAARGRDTPVPAHPAYVEPDDDIPF